MKTIHSFSAIAATLLLLSAVGRTQTTINSVPYTISAPGSYILGADSQTAGAGIKIEADDVTLDLNGHSLYGGSDSVFPGTAIYSNDHRNITVKNGKIRDFEVGVGLYQFSDQVGAGQRVESLDLIDCPIPIVVIQTAGSIIQNNHIIYRLGKAGGPGILVNGGGNRVNDNVISGFIGDSAIAFTSAAFSGNYSVDNTISNCDVGIDNNSGVVGEEKVDKYRFNTTFNCTTPFKSGVALTDENN
jgi:hypothetical protein